MISFTSSEKQAIYNMSMAMMVADGRITVEEHEYWIKVGDLLSMAESEKQSAASLSKSQVITTLRGMTAQKKMVALKVMTEMAMADGRLDQREDYLLKSFMNDVDMESAINTCGGVSHLTSILDSYHR